MKERGEKEGDELQRTHQQPSIAFWDKHEAHLMPVCVCVSMCVYPQPSQATHVCVCVCGVLCVHVLLTLDNVVCSLPPLPLPLPLPAFVACLFVYLTDCLPFCLIVRLLVYKWMNKCAHTHAHAPKEREGWSERGKREKDSQSLSFSFSLIECVESGAEEKGSLD